MSEDTIGTDRRVVCVVILKRPQLYWKQRNNSLMWKWAKRGRRRCAHKLWAFFLCCFFWASGIPQVHGTAWYIKGHPVCSTTRFPSLCWPNQLNPQQLAVGKVSSWLPGKILGRPQCQSDYIWSARYMFSRTEGLGVWTVFSVNLSVLREVGYMHPSLERNHFHLEEPSPK